jgi:hypothetical protein
MYSTSRASCLEGSEQLGLAARRPQPSYPLVLEINAGGVVRLLTFWGLDKSEVHYKQTGVGVSCTRRAVILDCLAHAQRSQSPSRLAEGSGRDLLYPRDAVEAQAVLQGHRRAIDKMAGG